MAEKYILVALAGIAAERILTGRKVKAGSYQDGRTAGYYMDQLVYEEEEVKAYSEWLLAHAENLLRLQDNWFAVETLADELLKEKYIGSKRAHEIIRAAWKDSVPQFKSPPEE
jgi:hypothetical protein